MLRCTNFWFVLLALCATSVAAQELRISPGLTSHLRLVEISIAGGRITIANKLDEDRRIFGNTTSSGRLNKEQMRLEINQALVPRLEYENRNNPLQVAISIDGDGQATFEREGKTNSPYTRVRLEQRPGQPLRLTLASASKEQTLVAPMLWHFLLAEPEIGARDLVPMFQILRPEWNLMREAEQLRAALLEHGATSDPAAAQQYQRWVDELASGRFATRRQAERHLAEAGQPAALYLEMLDERTLDAEQRYRVGRLLSRQLAREAGDTPQRLAYRMAGDVETWLAIMQGGPLEERRSASEILAQLVAAPLAFDPTAPPEERREQIAAIRAKAGRAPVTAPPPMNP